MVIIYRAPFVSVNELKHCLDLRPGNHVSIKQNFQEKVNAFVR